MAGGQKSSNTIITILDKNIMYSKKMGGNINIDAKMLINETIATITHPNPPKNVGGTMKGNHHFFDICIAQ